MTVKELILSPGTENERYKGRFPAIELPRKRCCLRKSPNATGINGADERKE